MLQISQLVLQAIIVINVALGIIIFVNKRHKDLANLFFTLVCFCLAGWSLMLLLSNNATTEHSLMICGKGAYLFGFLISAFFLYFTVFFTKLKTTSKQIIILIALHFLLILLLNLSNFVIQASSLGGGAKGNIIYFNPVGYLIYSLTLLSNFAVAFIYEVISKPLIPLIQEV